MKKAVITILGIQGGKVVDGKVTIFDFDHQAKYFFENQEKENAQKYFNTLPLLIDKYSSQWEIIPMFTQDARLFNQEILKHDKKELQFSDDFLIEDERDFKKVFAKFDKIIDGYDEVIVDLTHGFRHLPLLMLVDLLIHNFRDTKKIQQILFAKEEDKHTAQKQGIYEIINLKEYLELSNISFILTTFEKNYTVANHISSNKYGDLIEALNDVSNDIMALNLNNLFNKSIKMLIKELSKIDDPSIIIQAKELKKAMECTFKKDEKRYLTYYNLSKVLFDKNYMLLSLALLFESIRLYIKTTIKKEHKEIVIKVEKQFHQDLYKIGDFFKNLKWKNYEILKTIWQNYLWRTKWFKND